MSRVNKQSSQEFDLHAGNKKKAAPARNAGTQGSLKGLTGGGQVPSRTAGKAAVGPKAAAAKGTQPDDPKAASQPKKNLRAVTGQLGTGVAALGGAGKASAPSSGKDVSRYASSVAGFAGLGGAGSAPEKLPGVTQGPSAPKGAAAANRNKQSNPAPSNKPAPNVDRFKSSMGTGIGALSGGSSSAAGATSTPAPKKDLRAQKSNVVIGGVSASAPSTAPARRGVGAAQQQSSGIDAPRQRAQYGMRQNQNSSDFPL